MAAYDLVDTFAAVKALAMIGDAGTIYGTRFHLGLIPARETLPYVRADIIDVRAFRTFEAEGYDMTLQLSAWHSLDDGPAGAADGAKALRERVGKVVLSITGQDNLTCHVAAERGPFRDSDLWRVDLDLTIRSLET